MTIIQGTLAAEERLQWLADQLASDGSITIAAAADALGVSGVTIRRDLVALEERGTARRVRGGARAVGPQTFAARRDVAGRAKSRIAAKVAELLPESGWVALDASSTVMRLAPLLAGARDLAILTNGLDTFNALQDLAGISPMLTGGELDRRTGSLVGPIACRTAAQLSVDTFIASAAALTTAGAFEATMEEAEVKRSIAAGAGRVILAVDATKLQARSLALGLDWDQIDVLVTELDPEEPVLRDFLSLATVV